MNTKLQTLGNVTYLKSKQFGQWLKRIPKSRQAYLAAVTLLVFSVVVQILIIKPPKTEAQTFSVGPNSPASTANCVNDNSYGTTPWTNPGQAFADDNVNATVTLNGGFSDGSQILKCTNFGFSIPTQGTISNIIIRYRLGKTGFFDSVGATYMVVKNNIAIGAKTDIGVPFNEGEVVKQDLWGAEWTPADINASNFGAALTAGTGGSGDPAFVDSMSITVEYTAQPMLSMVGFVWENDDEDQAFGDAYDENSQQAAGNTAVTDVRKGERLTLRSQIKNTGLATFNNELGLFYDKNGDNNFIKANFPDPLVEAGNCGTNNAWDCQQVQTTGGSVNIGTYSSMAMSPDGVPYVVYIDDGTSDDLRLATYVGSGGNCNNSPNVGSSAWQCTIIESADEIGQVTSIAFSPTGVPYITYYQAAEGDMRLAQYVGSGGTGCATNAWTCIDIETTNEGAYNSIAFGSSGTPQIAYYDAGVLAINFAYYVGSGGDCTGNAAWECDNVELGSSGAYASIAVGADGIQTITWQDFSFGEVDLRAARYVGTNGNCYNTAWQCTTIDSTGSTGYDTSVAISPDNIPYISYYDSTNSSLRVARYVGSGGDCTGSAMWECTTIDANNVVGQHSSIAFSPSGVPYISYNYATGNDTRIAQYVGSGGNCDSGTYGGSADADAWNCSDVDAVNGGNHTSLAFDINGVPYISYHGIADDDLRVARLARGGDISLAVPSGGAHGDALNESHADMTSVSNTANRDDADCIGGGTWSNGKLFAQEAGSTLQLSASNCTEVAFVVDTSQATPGATYRFIIASADSIRNDKGRWRGPGPVTQFATLTVVSDTDFKASKGAESQGGSCAAAAWTCRSIDTTGIVGEYSSITFSPSGVPYISYYDSTNGDLRVAQYVGSGGTGCAVTSWTCTSIDTANAVGFFSSIAFSPSGVPYVGYRDGTNSDLRVAQYVGSGGTGCAVTSWTCTSIDTANAVGSYVSLAISSSGVPYVSYWDATNLDLRIAQYVGSGGTGCAVTSWTCTSIDTAGSTGPHTAIAFSPSGVPYVSYQDFGNGNLRIAQYVGSGGTGCAVTSWTCTVVQAVDSVGEYTSIAFSPTGVPYVTYQDTTGNSFHLAQYVGGSSGTGCGAGGSTAWTCTTIDNTGSTSYSSIAFSPTGIPSISYYDTMSSAHDLKVAQYVGSGGTGCAGTSVYTCTIVDSTNDVGQYTSIAFSPSGVPYVSYRDATNSDLRVAQLAMYDTSPITNSVNSGISNRNGSLGFGQYRLANGQSPRSNSTGQCGSSITDMLGICALYDDGGHMESMTAKQGERPYFNFSQRFDSNSILPTAAWSGRSDVAPSGAGNTGNIVLQVYRYGSTNAWETVATENSSTNCNTQNCYLKGIPGGPISEYYEAEGSNYWIHWRVWQYENTSGTETLKTDLFHLQFLNKQMRHGKVFDGNVRRNFTF